MASKLFALAAALGLALIAAPAAAAPSSPVPFVGCAEDGQLGPNPAPSTAPTDNVAVDAASAARLAYYKAADTGGVLAPRGWHCFGAYGSDGSVLYVAPGPIGSADVLTQTWAAGAGPAVVASWSTGDTSGRFQVAKVIMRLFPSFRSFAKKVIAEGIEPTSDFPAGPYPTDHTVTRTYRVVEYTTPGGKPGLGAAFGRLTVNASPISGVAVLQGATPDLAFLAARLPPDEQALVPAVVSEFELESGGPPPAPAVATEPTDDPSAALAAVRAFYTDLGRGDGVAASALIIPSKRTGNYAPAALTRFYGSLKQRLQVVSVDTAGGGVVEVHYSYTPASGRACDGAALVRTTGQAGHTLISRIEPANGC
jgi:hypothetical protein